MNDHITVRSPKHRTVSAPVLVDVSAALAWVGVGAIGIAMGSMPGTMGLTLPTFVAVWVLMMAAMMLPAAAPIAGEVDPWPSFVVGYLVVWAAVAIPVFGVARVADHLVLDHPNGARGLGVALLTACGVYELLPVKRHCLERCRRPPDPSATAARAGTRHGAKCVRSSWALMLTMVVFGLMNLVAMVAIAVIVFLEQRSRDGAKVARVVGVVALGLACAVVFVPWLAPGVRAHAMGSM
ncbi:MAG TPA: DUF2182 domain-containing protein [Acidimicrobiales bacterium]|nr:DUF2182 domain-containing protein [Acidimicrobiales bacterium]